LRQSRAQFRNASQTLTMYVRVCLQNRPRCLRSSENVRRPLSSQLQAPPAKKEDLSQRRSQKSRKSLLDSPKSARPMDLPARPNRCRETISLEGFGGEIETNGCVKTTLKKLVEESTAGRCFIHLSKGFYSSCKYSLISGDFQIHIHFLILIFTRHYASMQLQRFIC